MSVNYAEALSPYPNKGAVGQKEFSEDERSFKDKVARLADMFREAKGTIVVHTGAGISTAAGIPDFRGPNGVWTLEKQGRACETTVTFDNAEPTFSHKALVELYNRGYVKFIVSQNVDGLHHKSGFPLHSLAELHGNMFLLKCRNCTSTKVLNHASPTIGQKNTGIKCEKERCRGYYFDTVLDWEHELPPEDFDKAWGLAKVSGLNLVLGSSLQIQPANSIPLAAKKSRKKRKLDDNAQNTPTKLATNLAIVNLQKTKFHKQADLVIHEKIDLVMTELCKILEIDVHDKDDLKTEKLPSDKT